MVTAREPVVLSGSFNYILLNVTEMALPFTWSRKPREIQSPMLNGKKKISTSLSPAQLGSTLGLLRDRWTHYRCTIAPFNFQLIFICSSCSDQI